MPLHGPEIYVLLLPRLHSLRHPSFLGPGSLSLGGIWDVHLHAVFRLKEGGTNPARTCLGFVELPTPPKKFILPAAGLLFRLPMNSLCRA